MKNEFWRGMSDDRVVGVLVEFNEHANIDEVFSQAKPENSGELLPTLWWATMSVATIKALSSMEGVQSISKDSKVEQID